MMKKKKIAVSLNLDWPLVRYHDLYKGVQDYAEKHTLWNICWDHYPEIELKKCFDNPYYNGVIGRINHETNTEAKRLNIPVVNTWFMNEIENLPSIYPNYSKLGVTATEYLVNRGFRNFVSIEHKDEDSSKQYLEGVKSIVEKNELNLKCYSVDRNITDDKYQWAQFRSDWESWIEDWTFPLAIITSRSALIPKITAFCNGYDIKVPEQVALMTAGNEPAFCECNQTKISTVDINYYELGFKAAYMLDQQLQGHELKERTVFMEPGETIARRSTDTFSVKDVHVEQSLRYMLKNMSNDLDVDTIVDQVTVCRRTLEGKFKKELGHSIFEQLNQMRVELSKQLLTGSDRKVIHIQKVVGFSTPLQMRRTFSKYTGMSPMEYRNKMRTA